MGMPKRAKEDEELEELIEARIMELKEYIDRRIEELKVGLTEYLEEDKDKRRIKEEVKRELINYIEGLLQRSSSDIAARKIENLERAVQLIQQQLEQTLQQLQRQIEQELLLVIKEEVRMAMMRDRTEELRRKQRRRITLLISIAIAAATIIATIAVTHPWALLLLMIIGLLWLRR